MIKNENVYHFNIVKNVKLINIGFLLERKSI
jgi:hypothetical protein